MPRKPSGEVKTALVRQTQKNGDIYVYERRTIYDPEAKNTKVLGKKLIGKIPKGETEMIPTGTSPKPSPKDKTDAPKGAPGLAAGKRIGNPDDPYQTTFTDMYQAASLQELKGVRQDIQELKDRLDDVCSLLEKLLIISTPRDRFRR